MKQPIDEYDADAELGEAVKALREARWRLARASAGLFERYHDLLLGASKVESYKLGDWVSSADTLGAAVEQIATQTRRLRKRVRRN